MANIVPWKCDLNNRTILCDINKPVKAASGEAILQNEASLSVSDECYFSKIRIIASWDFRIIYILKSVL